MAAVAVGVLVELALVDVELEVLVPPLEALGLVGVIGLEPAPAPAPPPPPHDDNANTKHACPKKDWSVQIHAQVGVCGFSVGSQVGWGIGKSGVLCVCIKKLSNESLRFICLCQMSSSQRSILNSSFAISGPKKTPLSPKHQGSRVNGVACQLFTSCDVLTHLCDCFEGRAHKRLRSSP